MADTLKVLGQAAPPAATMTDLYTAPCQVVVSSIIICNRGFIASTFQLAVSPGGGASIEDKHYLYYNTRVPGNETLAAQIGVTLAAGDKLRVRAGNDLLSFSAFGIEVI